MDKVERLLLMVSRTAAIVGVIFLLGVAALSVVDILVREATGRPIRGAMDLSEMLTIIIIAACFPAGLMERRQIRVSFLGDILGRYVNRVLEVFGAVMTAIMFICIAYYMTLHAQRVSASAEYTMILHMPIAPWWWTAVACFWVCVPAQLFAVCAEILGRPAPAFTLTDEA